MNDEFNRNTTSPEDENAVEEPVSAPETAEETVETPDEEVLKGVNLFTEYYKEHLDVYTKPFNGIKELLIALKDNGFKIGVLSNKDDYAVKLLCDKWKF